MLTTTFTSYFNGIVAINEALILAVRLRLMAEIRRDFREACNHGKSHAPCQSNLNH